MNENKKIKIVQLFDSYSEFYQPYIPPVIESLRKVEGLKVTVNAFKGKSESDAVVFPSYYKRKYKEKLYQLTHRLYSKLNYAEMIILKKKIDIVHIQHSYLFPKLLGLLSLPANKRPKIIITLRGGDTYVKPWIQKKWADFYLNYGNKVDAFITMSENQKNYLHTKWGVNMERIHVIPISFGEEIVWQSKHPNNDVMKIISAFRMCWEKNIEGNLRVVKLLKEKGFPVQYAIYGDGPDVGQVHYLIDKYNLSDCVCYHGKIENIALKKILPKFDFYLQLSHSESLGISVVEAQAWGIPVIVSNSDGLPESIIDGKTGYTVDPFDNEAAAKHILDLWKNPNLYNTFSERALNFAGTKFTISQEVNKLCDVYLSLIKQ